MGGKMFIAALAAVALAGCRQQAAEEPVAIADNSINYIELRSTDMAAMKRFYGDAFGWTWTDYGPDYAAFAGAGVDGGIRLDEGDREPSPRASVPAALVVLYAADLESAQARVERAGGTIAEPIFSFPGGRRFHFLDPSGNELAIWSDRD